MKTVTLLTNFGNDFEILLCGVGGLDCEAYTKLG